MNLPHYSLYKTPKQINMSKTPTCNNAPGHRKQEANNYNKYWKKSAVFMFP